LDFMTSSELAKLLHISKRQVYKNVQSGAIPSDCVVEPYGNRKLFHVKRVKEWLNRSVLSEKQQTP
jgi:excisionase family DNA binding protein